jgi:hypothetical protein
MADAKDRRRSYIRYATCYRRLAAVPREIGCGAQMLQRKMKVLQAAPLSARAACRAFGGRCCYKPSGESISGLGIA